MTEFKKGDRVHVEYDGTIYAESFVGQHRWLIRAHGAAAAGSASADHMTLIPPAVAVGDVVTSLDGVPDGAILKDTDDDAQTVWTNDNGSRNPKQDYLAKYGPYLILWLPEATS